MVYITGVFQQKANLYQTHYKTHQILSVFPLFILQIFRIC